MWQRIIVGAAGAGAAEDAAFGDDLAAEVDAFAAGVAEDAGALEARQVLGQEADLDPLDGEELCGGEDAVGLKLLEGGFFEMGEELRGAVFAGFKGRNANGFAGFQIAKRSGHFSVIQEFEGAFSEAAAGDDADGVGGAAVDFDEGDEALAVGAEGVAEAEEGESVDGHADAEDLSGAEVAVGGAGEFFVFGEGFQHGAAP
jgi:hypothetical protein